MPDLWSVAEAAALLDRVRSGPGGDDVGAPAGQPVVVVDVDEAGPAVDLRPPVGWPCVIVAVSRADSAPPAPPGPDVLLSAASHPVAPWVGAGAEVADAAQALAAAVRRHPQAATTLAQVLRISPALPVPAALVIESLAYSMLQAGPEHREWLASRRPRHEDSRQDAAVVLERREDSLWITLDRPERRNAYSARMRDDLVLALDLAAADPTLTAVHLRGNGANFSSGGDLAEFGTLPDPASAHTIRIQRNAGWRLSQVATRVTTHLHGSCIGAGIELAAFAGTVEATENTTVALPEVQMGLIPGAGGTASIPRRIGAARTAWLALTGATLDADTARRWGLVDRVVPDGAPPAV
ncbi:MAG TPA: enoyl-CoA hydratase/isomerase family protein [Acidimicrobiales bacterium]